MKILFVGEAVSGFGGTETVIKKLTSFIEHDTKEENQYMLYFLCRNHKMDKAWLEGKNAQFEYAKLKISFIRKMQYVSGLAKYIKQYNPDVIISFDIPTCELASKAISKTKLSIPLISWIHYSLEHKKRPECVLFADYHLAISSGIKEQLVNRGVFEDRVFTIFNPVSPSTDTIPRPSESEPKSFIYVGRMKFEGQKQLKLMLDSFAKVNGNWVLHMVGNGSDDEVCRNHATQLGIADKVKWHGWRKSPWNYVKHSIGSVNALVLTSKFEGFGLVLTEAMSLGIYCISSNCPSGPADIIIDDINGKLYPVGQQNLFETELDEIINGKILPSASQIKSSIDKFYDEQYYNTFRASLCHILKTN